MTGLDAKADLHRYLREAREALLGKLDGLSEYDVRRPLVPTGTNLLGLVKHVALVAAGYFGEVFDRPFPEPVAGLEADAEPNVDMWAAADESREDIIGLWHRVWAHADATIETLPFDASGSVWWWGHKPVTLHLILVHVLAELNRHAGHADIVRELVDGQVGRRRPGDNMVEGDEAWWASYRERLEATARKFACRRHPRADVVQFVREGTVIGR
ncbi:DinB family protein [Micromonospora rosaria]|uniref:DinB family protein n=1 Tax=Micromonospora rosaria TaxID=47874 RepID=UPI000A01340F|nr:DinB family protein [Micromonospora rosaria]